MYILKNSWKNLLRNKGRNILVGLVMLAIIATTVVALVINSTTSAIIDDFRTRFGSRVIISLDVEAFLGSVDSLAGSPPNIPQVTPEQSIIFAESDYLFDYFITGMTIVGNNSMTAIDDLGDSFMFSGMGFEGDELELPKFRLMGNQFDEFETGERFLLNGRMPETEREALISQEIANINGLSVGDEFTVYRSTFTPEGTTMYVRNSSFTFVVAGIYFDMSDTVQAGLMPQSPLLNRRNEILITLDALISMAITGDGVSITATYYLGDPAYLSNFEAEIREKGLHEMMIVSLDETSFNTIVEPVEGMRSISITFMIVVLVLGAIILVLLSSIAIRERKYEIGVLRAMGMKKGKVAKGLLYEMGTLTAICLALGLVAGTIAAQPVADTILRQQVEAVGHARATGHQEMGTVGGMILFDLPEVNPAEPLSEISVSVGIDVMVQIAAISLLLAFIASMIGIVNITKYEPIKILMERN